MKVSIGNKIRDWFSITKIRITNFIKEHKYVSLAVVVFIVSAIIIGFAVRAADDMLSHAGGYVINNFSVKTEAIDDNDELDVSHNNNIAPNFSTVTYTLNYKLGPTNSCDNSKYVDKVTIEATLSDSYSYAKWLGTSEDAAYTISDDKKTITVDISSVQLCQDQSQSFTLSVLNAEKESPINISSLKFKSASEDSLDSLFENMAVSPQNITTTYDDSKEIDSLTVELKPGIAQKNTVGGRNARYGLMLGFYPSGSVQAALNEGISALKGSYISTNADIYLSASEIDSDNVAKILGLSDANGDYGVYTSEIDNNNHFFPDLPVLSSSGSVGTLTKTIIDSDSEESVNYNEAPIISLGSKNLTYETYSEEDEISPQKISIKNGSTWTEVECNASNNCTFNADDVDLLVEGTYEATYKVTNSNGSTTLKQTIEVKDSTQEDSEYATLKGPSTLYLSNNITTFNDPGIIYDDETYSYEVYYYEEGNESLTNSSLLSLLPTSITGTHTYIGVYKILEPDATGSGTATEVGSIQRKIVIRDNAYESSAVKVVSTSKVGSGLEYTETGLYVNNDRITCSASGTPKCESNLQTDSLVSGTTDVTYTITTDDEEIKITKNINVVSTYYKLPISGLSLSDNVEIVKIDNLDFCVLGTYFVTVPTSSSNSTITLSAFVGNDPSVAKSIDTHNNEISTGTNIMSNDIYVRENDTLVKVDSDDKDNLDGNYYTAAMGETIEVVTKYNYGYDADAKMNDFKILLDIDNNYLKPVARDMESTSNTPYYSISFSYFGEELNIDPLEYLEMHYCTSSDSCTIDPGAETDEDVITNVEVKVKTPLKAGTIITLKTNYIVTTVTESSEDLNELKFNTSAHVTYNSGTIPMEEDTTSKSVYLTPYKLRTNVYLGQGDDLNKSNITLDAAKNDVYTYYASTTVTSPAMALNTNLFGYEEIANIPIIITLPSGINYIYNADYIMQPDDINGVVRNSDGSTTLTYTYQGVKPNSWVESIYFDFNIDVGTPSQTVLSIVTKVGDWTTVSLANDLSSTNNKQITSGVTVLNTEDIAYGQYAYETNKKQVISSIDKNEEFIFNMKLRNNTSNVISDVYAYTILPYNDVDLSNYGGSYDITFPTDVTLSCTSDAQSEIANNPTSANWTDCSSFGSNGNYTGITAYRIYYESLSGSEVKSVDVKIKTNSNSSDDKYVFQSYLSYEGQTKKFKNLTVNVISKKITGTVWEDFNDNGLMDDDEKRVENVTLKLYNSSNNLIDTTTPNKYGVYTFSGFEEGEYYIVAEFNNDKYALTTQLGNTSDFSKISVFKNSATGTVINGETEINNNDFNEEVDEEESEEQISGDISEEAEEDEPIAVVKTDIINITSDTRAVNNINLGLSLRKKFQIKLTKYITSADVTNNVGIVTRKDYGNSKLAKLDIRDINNVNIKVVYTIEMENVKYYPGYIKVINETIPDGMSFNENYSENDGWVLNEDGTLTNTSLANDLLNEGDKRYVTIAFDITRKEAGSFVNTASVDDLEVLGGASDE